MVFGIGEGVGTGSKGPEWRGGGGRGTVGGVREVGDATGTIRVGEVQREQGWQSSAGVD